MITNARVLRPEFVPRDVVHRDAEVSHLSSALAPLTNGNPAETALLCGPSGAGKTCTARFTLQRLRENTLNVASQYVNCWEDSTRFKLLYRLLEGLDRSLDIHRQSTPRTNSSNASATTKARHTSSSSTKSISSKIPTFSTISIERLASRWC